MQWKHTPLHEVLTDFQSKRKLTQLNLKESELALISYADAELARLRNDGVETPLGAVVKITRHSKSAGEGFVYLRKIIP